MSDKTYENPYLNARREWNERYGEFVQAAYHWRLAALGSLVLAFIGLCGAIYMGSQSKLIPFIVEIDPKGHLLSTSAPEPGHRPDGKVIQSFIADWFIYHRSVVGDTVVQRQYIERAYAYVASGSAAKSAMDGWYSTGGNPFKRIATENVTVEISSVLSLSKDSYQVEWGEKSFDPSGKPLAVESYRALVSLEFHDVEAATLSHNPLGLFFTSISIQKIGV